jgi:hypothetical protein
MQRSPIGGGSSGFVYPIGTGTVLGPLLLSLNETVKTTIKGHPKKSEFGVSLDQRVMDENYLALMESYLTESSDETAVAEYTKENNVKETSSAAAVDADTVVYTGIGGVLNGKREVVVLFGKLTGATGDHEWTANTHAAGALEFKAIKTDKQIVIPANVFDSSLVTGSAITLATGEKGAIVFMTAV